MRRFSLSQYILSLGLIIVLGLATSACGGIPSKASQRSSSPATISSPAATVLPVRAMRIDIAGYRLYLRCMGYGGHGSPTVIFEAGLGGDVHAWDQVQPGVAQFTQACAYDRANAGQSDQRPAALKVSAQQLAGELHALLVNANLPGPYILVGHSLGGLFVQMYACQYPQEVAGIVLVDSTHPEQAVRLAAALGPEYAQQARQGFPAEGMTYNDVIAMQAQVEAVRSRFPDVPLVVLVRSRFTSSQFWTAAQFEQVWMSLQTDLSKLSSRGKLVVAQNSSHDIPNDRPDLIISSIREVIHSSAK